MGNSVLEIAMQHLKLVFELSLHHLHLAEVHPHGVMFSSSRRSW